jgi:hypothetical protein
MDIYKSKYSYTRKNSGDHKVKGKRGKSLSPRIRKACHSIVTALLQSVAEIGTQSTMKSSRKTLHEFSPQSNPPKNAEKEHKKCDEPNVAYGHSYSNAKDESQQHPCQIRSDELLPKLPCVIS